MTDREMPDRVRLSRKQEFCLRRLGEADRCSYSISRLAVEVGENRTICRDEWADAPLRELRQKGLIGLTGEWSAVDRRVHHITDRGRAALAKLNGEE